MIQDANLFNAAVVGENPDSTFIIMDGKLHAIDKRVADLRKNKSDPAQIVKLMTDALKALISFSKDHVEPHFLEVDWNSFNKRPNVQEAIISKINHIYHHLPHCERNKLTSLIHHPQVH